MKPKVKIIKSPEVKRYQVIIATTLLSTLTTVLASLMMGVAYFSINQWNSKPKSASCTPVYQEFNLPFVYRQSKINPVNSDAIIKRFIEEYVSLTLNEEYINYHAATNNARYSDNKVSDSKWKAIYLSEGDALNIRRKDYYNSSTILQTLKKGKLGWNFFIDDIVVRGLSDGSEYAVEVRGEYRVITDQRTSKLPAQLDGYWELTYHVVQGPPSENSERKYINKYGLYVVWEQARSITPVEKDLLMSRDRSFYQREYE